MKSLAVCAHESISSYCSDLGLVDLHTIAQNKLITETCRACVNIFCMI